MPPTAQQPPASASRPLVTGTATVVVGCRLPQGHRARLHVKKEITEQLPSGIVQTVTRYEPTGEEFLFKGPAHGQNEGPRVVTAHGAALTFGVPADFWDRWSKQHRDYDLYREGYIFAFERANDVKAAAKERRKLKTGLERIDPTQPVRIGNVVLRADPDSPVAIGRLDVADEDA